MMRIGIGIIVLMCLILVLRRFRTSYRSWEYLCLLILLVGLLWTTLHLYTLRESFSQSTPPMLQQLVQMPKKIQDKITSGIDYIIEVQSRSIKNDASDDTKGNFVTLTKDTLQDPNLSDEQLRIVGTQYVSIDDMLNVLKRNHPSIYEDLLKKFPSEDPYEEIEKTSE